jgi:predicted hotdog family 3-hydroxylacyl-ACP dehydratase
LSDLDHAAIAARIPHAGAMCLLERVLSWDASGLACLGRAATGGDGPHPLARAGRLPSVAAIEYAAQAMALHGRLVLEQAGDGNAGGTPPRGFLAALRGVRLSGRWLAADDRPLRIRVARFAGDAQQVLYDFTVEADGPVAAGRAVVVLDARGRREGAG